MGEYRCGLAVRVIEVFVTTDNVGGSAGITAHLPFVHPQLPAPQSSGPSQLMVHMTLSQTGFAASRTQLVGWQHCAGTQSASVVQDCASTGAVVRTVTGGRGVVTAVTGEGVCDVQPAKRTAAMQMTTSASAFLSIQENNPLWHVLKQTGTGIHFAIRRGTRTGGFSLVTHGRE